MIGLLTVFWKEMLLHLWQTSLFLGVIFLLDIGLIKAPARFRHTLWQIGLIRIFLPLSLVKAAASGLYGWIRPGTGGMETISIHGISALGPVVDPAIAFNGLDRGGSLIPGAVITIATILWTATVMIFLFRMITDLRRTAAGSAERLTSLIDGDAAKLAGICGACGIDVSRVLLTGERLMPGVTGILRPRIVIPRELVRSLGDDELTAILLHEENHRYRMDPLRSLFARLGLALFHFYPLIYPLLRRLHATAEYACDEVALYRGISPVTYARAFTKTLRIGLVPGGMHYSAAGRNGSLLKKRFKRLFEPRRYEMSYTGRVIIALAVLILVAGFLVPVPSVAGGEEVSPEVIKTVQPEYPKECLKAGYACNLLLHVVVDEKGAVKEAKVTTIEMYTGEKKEMKENPDEATMELSKKFQKASLAAIYQWEFKPGTRDGKPVEMELKIPVEFKLE
jgi:beta-lactamase regulating signal transducer with metallopeptidase domain